MTTWLVDGMNVIGSRPDGWWRDRRGAQARLARELAAWAAATGVRVEVVFDGAPHEISGADAVDVAFASRRGRNAADDDIAARVAGADDPGAIRVVTADRELAARVRAAGGAVVAPSELRARMERAG
ncbi:MAG: NYN domain-containing protein [Solirubrobacteraceae bacterium]